VTLPGDAVVVVEDGEVSAHSSEVGRITRAGDGITTAITPGIDVTLFPGDVAFLPAGSSTVRASDPRSSFIVAVAIPETTAAETRRWDLDETGAESDEGGLVTAMLHAGAEGPVTAEGMLVDRLAWIRPLVALADEVGLDLGRVILRPGASLHLRSHADARGIAIEAGELELDSMDGRLEIQQSLSEGWLTSSFRIGEAVTLATGDAVIVPMDHDAELRNIGDVPSTILIVVLASGEAPPSSPMPTTVAISIGDPPISSIVQSLLSTPTAVAIASPAPFSVPNDGPALGHPS
jgi:quercetin dioxygenase-like cupin family protein